MSSQSQSYTNLTAAPEATNSREFLSNVSHPEEQQPDSMERPLFISIEVDVVDSEVTPPKALTQVAQSVEVEVSLGTPTSLPMISTTEQIQAPPPMTNPASPQVMNPASPQDMPPPPPVPIPLKNKTKPRGLPANALPMATDSPMIDPMARMLNKEKPAPETRLNMQGVAVQEPSFLLPQEAYTPSQQEPFQPPVSEKTGQRISSIPVQRPELAHLQQPPIKPPRSSSYVKPVPPSQPGKHSNPSGLPPSMMQQPAHIQTQQPQTMHSSGSMRTLQPQTMHSSGSMRTLQPQTMHSSGSMRTLQPQAIRSSTSMPPLPSPTHSTSTVSPLPSMPPLQNQWSQPSEPFHPGHETEKRYGFPHQPVAPAHLPVQRMLPTKRQEQSSHPHARLSMNVAPSREEITQVKQLVHLLHRAYQAFEFYPFNHPIVQQFSQQLFQQLQRFFQFREMLELRLDRFQIRYCGQMIFEDNSLTNNFVYLLFSDGIRKLIIDSGLTEDEYLRFFMVLHRSSTRRSITEDTITLLWEQQFVFIRYFLVEDLTEMFLPDLQALHDNLAQKSPRGHLDSSIKGSEQAVQIMGGLAQTRLAPSEEEKQLLQQLVQEEERGLMQRFLEIIARVLEYGEEVLQMDRLVRVLSQLQPILLSVGELEHLGMCLNYTSRLSKLFSQRNTAQAQEWHRILQEILRESHSEHVIQKLVTYMDQSPHNETIQHEVFQYIQWLTPPNPDTLLKAFTWANSYATRQLLCRSLAEKYKGSPKQLISGVTSSNPIIVRNTCVILGSIGHISIRPLLQRAAKHDDPDVRAEATRALLQFGTAQNAQPQLVGLLKKNLTDNNADVRRTAIQGLPQLGQRGVALLRDLYKNRDHDQWSPEDQNSLFEMTIRMGQRFPECIEFMLQSVFKQYSGWLAGRKDPSLVRSVVQLLQNNGTPRAIAAIEKLYNDGSEPIRKACEFVTQKLR